jgi:hypothetical protein
MSRNRKFIAAFDRFWSFVARAEQDIRENEHRGRIPPDSFGDPWDEEFAAAYEAIQPHLKKFRKARFFKVPAGLAFFTGPFTAETAHQALMFYLNPPKELYGERGVLDLPEYVAIKEQAMRELQNRDEARVSTARKQRPSLSARMVSELIELRAYICDHHFLKDDRVRTTTLTSKEIGSHFGWSQATVSRKMSRIFKSNNGMEVYAAMFGTHDSDAGYNRKFDNETLSVEAIWHDRKPDDEVEEGSQDTDDGRSPDEDEDGLVPAA